MAGNETRELETGDSIHMNFDRDYQINRQIELINSTGTTANFADITIINRAPNRSLPIIPLSKTNAIAMEEIRQSGPDFVHKGKILLCRSIMPPAESEALTIVVDDPDGGLCSQVLLINYPATIRAGTILAIMHPWYDIVSMAIRVANPVHIHVVDDGEDLVRDVVWKVALPKESGIADQKPITDPVSRGNAYFEDKNYPKAIEAYSKAIQINRRNPILYLKRATTFLKIENPALALRDAETGLKLRPSIVKLQIRKAMALIELKRYEDAALFMKKASEDYKDPIQDSDFTDLFTATNRMVDESKNGDYNITGMMDEAKRSKLLENHADYIAWDKIKITDTAEKGHGLVAKQRIERGTLLLASKAFVYADVSERSSTIIDWSSMTAESPVFGPLIRKTCAKISTNPEFATEFYRLYAGKKLGQLNKVDPSNPLDIDRIAAIIRSNTLSDEDGLCYDTKFRTAFDGCGGGLWLVASLINHSCVDFNLFYFVVGNFIFVRTIKEVQEGEELLINYVSSRLPFKERSSHLARFDFHCSCRLCQADLNDSKKVQDRCDEIRNILRQLGGSKDDFHGRNNNMTVAILKRLINEVEDYREDLTLNFLLEDTKRALGLAILEKSSSSDEAMRQFVEVFENRKEADDLHSAFSLAQSLVLLAYQQRKDDNKWIRVAHDLSQLLYGDRNVCNRLEMAYKMKILFF